MLVLLDLDGLNCHWMEDWDDYVVIESLGKVKGKYHDIAHLQPSIPINDSGLEVREAL